jgi:hypothetical protein
MRLLRTLVAFLFLAALPVASAQAKIGEDVKALLPPTTSNYYEFDDCNQSTKTFCIETYGIDVDGDGTYTTPDIYSPINMRAWLFDLSSDMPGLGWELNVANNQELDPLVPVGTRLKVRINTGGFRPNPNLFATAKIIDFAVFEENGNWITTSTFETIPYSSMLDCDSDPDCDKPKNRRDYRSFAQSILRWDDPSPTTEAQANMWVATNASTVYELQFDREKLEWSVLLLSPLTKADGSRNEVMYESFIPDTAISFLYGTTADLLARNLTVTRTEMDVTTAVKASITRLLEPVPGILISIPDIRFNGKVVEKKSKIATSAVGRSVKPEIRVSPKKPVLPEPRNVRVRASKGSAVVSSSTVRGAKKYEAMCSRGAQAILTKGAAPSITMKGLTPGKWKCQMRSLGSLAGNWSAPVTVTAKR